MRKIKKKRIIICSFCIVSVCLVSTVIGIVFKLQKSEDDIIKPTKIGLFSFDSFEETRSFYLEFKKKNKEVYLIPNKNLCEYNLIYNFRAADDGISFTNYIYNTKFYFQSFSIYCDEFTIFLSSLEELESFDIKKDSSFYLIKSGNKIVESYLKIKNVLVATIIFEENYQIDLEIIKNIFFGGFF